MTIETTIGGDVCIQFSSMPGMYQKMSNTMNTMNLTLAENGKMNTYVFIR